MFERDYLMRLILQFAEAIRRSWEQLDEDDDPRGAAETLEAAIGEATDLDGEALLSLTPESIAAVIQVSGVDPRVTEYVARSMLLESVYLRRAQDDALADLREAQARALAEAYGFELPDDPSDFDKLARDAEEGVLDEIPEFSETPVDPMIAIERILEESDLR